MDTRTVHLAVYDTLADWEYGYAAAHINSPQWQRQPGRYRVATVGETGEPVTTSGGVRIIPDTALAKVDPQESAMLILPGANAWDEGGLGALAEKAREFLDHDVPVAAICGATFGLARAGLLDTREHTSSVAEYLAASGYAGADRYVEQPVVDDGGLITAGPQSPVDFARAIFERLDMYERDVLDAWYAFYRHQDAAPMTALIAASQETAASPS